MKIQKDISIEDLVEKIPGSVKYLMKKGIKCVACGEPVWGTLEEAAKDKGFKDDDIDRFVNELNKLYEERLNFNQVRNNGDINFQRVDKK